MDRVVSHAGQARAGAWTGDRPLEEVVDKAIDSEGESGEVRFHLTSSFDGGRARWDPRPVAHAILVQSVGEAAFRTAAAAFGAVETRRALTELILKRLSDFSVPAVLVLRAPENDRWVVLQGYVPKPWELE